MVEEPFGDVPDFWNRTGTASSGTTAARGPAEPGRDQHLSRVVGAQAGHEGGEPVTPHLFCFLRWQHAPELDGRQAFAHSVELQGGRGYLAAQRAGDPGL